MSFDIYGQRLRPGHCEVHPHVHEEYPCSVCLAESANRRNRNTGPHPDQLQDELKSLRASRDELLDALQVCLGHLTGGMDGDWRECDPIELARAAIAKAQGEAQP